MMHQMLCEKIVKLKKSTILWTWVQDAVSYHYRVMRCLLKIYVLTWHCAALAQGRLSSALTLGSAPFFFTHCWYLRSLLVVCFGAPAMVVENLKCGFLSCYTGGVMETLFISFLGARECACTCQLKCVWEFVMPWYVDWFLCISQTIMRVLSL